MKTDLLDLRNVDCMELMAGYPDGYFDWAVVDPPYFDGPQKLGFYGGRCSKTGVARNGYKKLGTWQVPGQDYFDELVRVSKNQLIWGFNYYSIENLGSGRLIWDKLNAAPTFSDCEVAYLSSIDSVRKYTYMWNGMMQGSAADGSVMEGNKRLNEKRIHPTQKPVRLYAWFFENYVEAGQRVLDTHLGSASSAVAAHYAGLEFVGCELDPEYFLAACDRVERDTRQEIMKF